MDYWRTQFPSYVFGASMMARAAGGVLLAIGKNLCPSARIEFQVLVPGRCVAALVTGKTMSAYFVNLHLVPGLSDEERDGFFRKVAEAAAVNGADMSFLFCVLAFLVKMSSH